MTTALISGVNLQFNGSVNPIASNPWPSLNLLAYVAIYNTSDFPLMATTSNGTKIIWANTADIVATEGQGVSLGVLGISSPFAVYVGSINVTLFDTSEAAPTGYPVALPAAATGVPTPLATNITSTSIIVEPSGDANYIGIINNNAINSLDYTVTGLESGIQYGTGTIEPNSGADVLISSIDEAYTITVSGTNINYSVICYSGANTITTTHAYPDTQTAVNLDMLLDTLQILVVVGGTTVASIASFGTLPYHMVVAEITSEYYVYACTVPKTAFGVTVTLTGTPNGEWYIIELPLELRFPKNQAQTINITQPAAGADWNFTLPVPAKILSITGKFLASSQSSTRQLTVVGLAGTASTFGAYTWINNNVSASTEVDIQGRPGNISEPVQYGNTIFSYPPDIFYPAGTEIQSVTFNMESEDQWSDISIQLEPI